jgi:gamma-butyrobetaine dioxygenase
LHTDLPAEELAPGIQFLHCRVNDAQGGNSLFVDATAVANVLKKIHPTYFKILTEYAVPFRYTTDYQDVRTKQLIIELDPNNGEVSGINFSQHLADVFDFSQCEMDVFYPAFRKFGQMLQDTKYLMTFRLNAGECMVFDNHRIAHGRASFIKGSGARHLRGCYVDRGDLRSVYRVLRARNPKVKVSSLSQTSKEMPLVETF